MKHIHITIPKKDLERFKTACEINIGTRFLHTSQAVWDRNVTCYIEYNIVADVFYLGAKWERNENA